MSADASERFSEIQKEIYRHGYDRGRTDAIDKCIDILNNSIPLVDNTDIVFGFKCAVERLKQLKEQKNG